RHPTWRGRTTEPPGSIHPPFSVLFRPKPENVDLLGYLLGCFIAQVIACEHPPLAEEFYSSAPLRGVVRIHLLHQVLHVCPTLAPDASIRTRAAHSPRSL